MAHYDLRDAARVPGMSCQHIYLHVSHPYTYSEAHEYFLTMDATKCAIQVCFRLSMTVERISQRVVSCDGSDFRLSGSRAGCKSLVAIQSIWFCLQGLDPSRSRCNTRGYLLDAL